MVADSRGRLPRYNNEMQCVRLLVPALAMLLGDAEVQLLSAENVPREILQLARVKAHMSDLLTRLPNYTCLQNIERSRRVPSGRTQLVDVVRLEVALVDGDELFAWPGSKKFQDTKIIDMVKGGAIGNGNFALHAKSVFQSTVAQYTYIGEREIEGGRQTLAMGLQVCLSIERLPASLSAA